MSENILGWAGLLLSGGVTLLGVAVAWGALGSRIKTIGAAQDAVAPTVALVTPLVAKHDALAAEVRPAIQTLQAEMSAIQASRASHDARLEGISRDVGEIKASLADKASKESVTDLRTDISELKQMVASLPRGERRRRL